MKVSEATQLKIDKLYEEMGKVDNLTLRANLLHTFEKLLLFLDEDFEHIKCYPCMGSAVSADIEKITAESYEEINDGEEEADVNI